jgi:hypothetical protein
MSDAIVSATEVVHHLRETGLLQVVGEEIGQGIARAAIAETMKQDKLGSAAGALADALENLLPWVQGTHNSELSDGTPCDCDRCDKLHRARAALRLAGRIS